MYRIQKEYKLDCILALHKFHPGKKNLFCALLSSKKCGPDVTKENITKICISFQQMRKCNPKRLLKYSTS